MFRLFFQEAYCWCYSSSNLLPLHCDFHHPPCSHFMYKILWIQSLTTYMKNLLSFLILTLLIFLPFNFWFRLDDFGVFDACRPTECTKTQTRSVNTFRKTAEKDPKMIEKKYTVWLIFQAYNKTPRKSYYGLKYITWLEIMVE